MDTPISNKSPRFYPLLLAAFLLLIGALGWRAATKMMGMSSASAASASELQDAKPGDAIKLVMQIQQTDGKIAAKGKLLERKDDTHYRRTAQAIAASFDQSTKIVMGRWQIFIRARSSTLGASGPQISRCMSIKS